MENDRNERERLALYRLSRGYYQESADMRDRNDEERAALMHALNETRAEMIARGLNEPSSFGGNREQRRRAKRAYDRATRKRS